jgi:hypothetical protein
MRGISQKLECRTIFPDANQLRGFETGFMGLRSFEIIDNDTR